jgi:S-adenosylmethionine synthetase
LNTRTEEMEILVTGASGLLGRSVYNYFKDQGYLVTGLCFSRSNEHLVPLDLTNYAAVDQFFKDHDKFNTVIHCAAEKKPVLGL